MAYRNKYCCEKIAETLWALRTEKLWELLPYANEIIGQHQCGF